MHPFGLAIDVDVIAADSDHVTLVDALERAGWVRTSDHPDHFECTASSAYAVMKKHAESCRPKVARLCSLWEEAATLLEGLDSENGSATDPANEESVRRGFSVAFEGFNVRLRENKADEHAWWERLHAYNAAAAVFDAFVADLNAMSPEQRAAYMPEYEERSAPLKVERDALRPAAEALNSRREQLIMEFASLSQGRQELLARRMASERAASNRSVTHARLTAIDRELGTVMAALRVVVDGASNKSVDGGRWTGSKAQLAFRDSVLAAHLRRNAKLKQPGPFRDLRSEELGPVLGTGARMRLDAAQAASNLVRDANLACTAARKQRNADAIETTLIDATSGYRSTAEQRDEWNGAFPRSYDDTLALRSAQGGGEHGDEAATLLAEYLGHRVAAPGYSQHTAGIAIDLRQHRSPGRPQVVNATTEYAVALWRNTWLYGWLRANASHYGFVPYEPEPWHWIFRGLGANRKAP
jgi:hypothetical protein